ncbi:NAD(P)-dependent oxidoreductase [Aggregatilinea lenta]|uniref:NAD(P)-dependent oxidoreductase n=1 Tax=Aggregatilinea lenta TaxID=913108 RepID=UPI000E5C4AD7|nr:NAD(P)-dependent oxidoreductase [Aggregatilinea lenta]
MSQHRASLDIDRKARAYAPVLPVAKQDAKTRLGHFEEIYLTYEAEIARAEASRCIQCPDPAPCVLGCAIGNDIPTALRLVEEGSFIEAANIFRRTSPMPEICSRVCPQERLCEGSCTHGGGVSLQPIQIGKIEKFVIEYQYATEGIPLGEVEPDTGKTVAIVGGGPAGMAAAERLRRLGHAVTVYDANPYPGGLLLYGIPAYKLQKERVVKKIEQLKAIGIQFVANTRIGQDIPLQQLADTFDAVFVGTGASVDSPPRWDGADLHGVYTATEFLIRCNVPVDLQPPALAAKGLPDVGHHVFVIGGGDTAMDCVRSALRLQHALGYSLDVACAYRRTEAEMPGSKSERVNAQEEGAKFDWLTAPVRFIGDEQGTLTGIEFVRMTLGEPDESGRRRPVPLEGSEFVAPADTVVLALGYTPDSLLGETTPSLTTTRWGLIVIDPVTGKTSLPNVWAGGDAVTGPELVGTAIDSALHAAQSITEYLRA